MNRLTLEAHGLTVHKVTGTQFICDCPFCGKEKHLYMHNKKFAWDCKVCGAHGGGADFLALRAEQYTRDAPLEELAENRSLPYLTLKDSHIGYFDGGYTIPYFSAPGKCTDIRKFTLDPRSIRSTIGAHPAIYGLEYLAPAKRVYICEGEWDTLAMRSILTDGVAVGLPGALMFRAEWAELFRDKDVIVCLDHDDAGRKGTQKCVKALGSIPKSVKVLYWHDELPKGYDIRDLIKDSETPAQALEILAESCKPVSIQERLEMETGEHIEPANIEDVIAEFRKWLYLPESSVAALKTMLAVMLSNRMQGDPLWLFLVGVPGDLKSEFLTAAAHFKHVHEVSTLNATSLISFYGNKDEDDPSLLKRINGMILSVKDFTAILTMRDDARTEMMGLLRDAYDGRVTRATGKAEKTIVSRFSLIAGVTPIVYEYDAKLTSLGARFIKIHMGDNLDHVGEDERIKQGQDNINREEEMRKALGDVLVRFMIYADTPDMAVVTEETRRKIRVLSRLVARFRGTVSRDKRDPTQILGRPSAEMGTRLGKQLTKLYACLVSVTGLDEMDIIRSVARHTISQLVDDVMRYIYPAGDVGISVGELMKITGYPSATVQRILEDLQALHVVTRIGPPTRERVFVIKAGVRELMLESGLYADAQI